VTRHVRGKKVSDKKVKKLEMSANTKFQCMLIVAAMLGEVAKKTVHWT